MGDTKQVCTHFMSGNCKYGSTCTKVHVSPTTELLHDIERKGSTICNFYPNCKFSNVDCKKLHIDIDNQYVKEIDEFKKLYIKITSFETNDQTKLNQIERIKFMIKNDLDIIRTTWEYITDIA